MTYVVLLAEKSVGSQITHRFSNVNTDGRKSRCARVIAAVDLGVRR